jgi:hypothetical protein
VNQLLMKWSSRGSETLTTCWFRHLTLPESTIYHEAGKF